MQKPTDQNPGHDGEKREYKAPRLTQFGNLQQLTKTSESGVFMIDFVGFMYVEST